MSDWDQPILRVTLHAGPPRTRSARPGSETARSRVLQMSEGDRTQRRTRINQLTIISFTGSDVNVHYIAVGIVVATLSVDTRESWKNVDGEWQSRAGGIVWSFGKQAEFTRTLTKGSYVIVHGAVRTREYERHGAKHGIVKVRGDTIGKLDRAERRVGAEG